MLAKEQLNDLRFILRIKSIWRLFHRSNVTHKLISLWGCAEDVPKRQQASAKSESRSSFYQACPLFVEVFRLGLNHDQARVATLWGVYLDFGSHCQKLYKMMALVVSTNWKDGKYPRQKQRWLLFFRIPNVTKSRRRIFLLSVSC